MKTGIFFALASALVGATMTIAAVPAAAQAEDQPEQAADDQETKTGSRFTRPKHDRGRGVRETLNHYGHCLATFKSDKIEAYLVDPTDERWRTVSYSPNSQTRCAIRNMLTNDRDMRGSVSEGWYVRRFKDGAPAVFVSGPNPMPVEEEVVARIAAAPENIKGDVIVDEFARCVAATAPMEVDAVLRTKVDSKQEQQTMQALAPAMGPCAFEGQNLAFDRDSLRLWLAYALATRAALTLQGAG